MSETRILSTPHYPVHIGDQALAALPALLAEHQVSRTLVVADSNTAIHCRGRLEAVLGPIELLALPAGEAYKSLDACQAIWHRLTEDRYDRQSCLLNLGGGLIGDVGGFAASCYKRGIGFVQIPTSLLAMVDASVGGKTGVKNQVGAFQDPWAVLVDPTFLGSLPLRELRAGYAEVLKHCLIADAPRWDMLAALPGLPDDWEPIISASIATKAGVVASDPLERGRRAILNFGHTVGHAVESWSLKHDADPLLHGEAVAVGMVCEAYLSAQAGLLQGEALAEISQTILRVFGHFPQPSKRWEALIAFTRQDKKNQGSDIRCALLDGLGHCVHGQSVPDHQIADSLAYYNNSAL
jgi:3-dehydroquinate synthase